MIQRLATGVRLAVDFAIEDIASVYSWRSWAFGWVARVVMQVVFYGLVGVMLDDPAQVRFIVVGNVTLIAAATVMLAVPTTQYERSLGTLPLLVASPSSALWAYLERSVEWLGDAAATSVVALVVVSPIFGLDLGPADFALVALLLVTVAFSSYGVSTLLAALVLRAPSLSNVVSNLAIGAIAIVAGANVPVEFFPPPVQALAAALPVTHGLRAIRAVFAGAPAGDVAVHLGLCVGVGVAWLVAAGASFDHFAERGRRTGALGFTS